MSFPVRKKTFSTVSTVLWLAIYMYDNPAEAKYTPHNLWVRLAGTVHVLCIYVAAGYR